MQYSSLLIIILQFDSLGAKLYSPWEPSIVEVTLVVSEWFKDRSRNLLEALDYTDHPFSHVIIMLVRNINNQKIINFISFFDYIFLILTIVFLS